MQLPKPITRTEYYLAKIAGDYTGNTPTPILRKEFYLANIAGDYTGHLPNPITRTDFYLSKIAGNYTGNTPKPITRKDYMLSAISGDYSGQLPEPITREEIYLTAIANQDNIYSDNLIDISKLNGYKTGDLSVEIKGVTVVISGSEKSSLYSNVYLPVYVLHPGNYIFMVDGVEGVISNALFLKMLDKDANQILSFSNKGSDGYKSNIFLNEGNYNVVFFYGINGFGISKIINPVIELINENNADYSK